MKKSKNKSGSGRFANTMRAEYDSSNAVRGATAARYGRGSNVVLLDIDVNLRKTSGKTRSGEPKVRGQ
jgi:hypothetical protein